MAADTADQQIAEHRRKEIFRVLVESQDRKMLVAESRKYVMQQFGVSEGQVRLIEREGMDSQWPPL
jgi:hypothetical protein